MRHLAALAACLLASCAALGGGGGTPPLILSASVDADGDGLPDAFVRTNMRQTLISGNVHLIAQLDTFQGYPILVHDIEAGKAVYIDRDLDIKEEYVVGQPVHPGAKVLFPLAGIANAFGVTFQGD